MITFALAMLAVASLSSAEARTESAPYLIPPAERGLPLIRNFLPRQYRGHEQVWAITETRDGLMLFANLNRISEYDGLNWRNIDVPGGSFIRAMIRDDAGTVWIGGVNEVGRLVPGADGKLVYESLRHLVPEAGDLGAFWCAHLRPDGVWLQSANALLRWNGKSFDYWKVESKGAALSYEFRDQLIVCGDQGWFTPLPGGKWRQVGGAELAPWLPRFSLPGPGGKWLVGTGAKGIMDFAADATYQPFPTEADEWLKKARPFSGRRLADGRYIIHSLLGGAVVLDANLHYEVLLDDTTGLATRTVITSFTDHRGNLWLGTDRGPSLVGLDSPVTTYDTRHGLGANGAASIERANDRIIVSSAGVAMELQPAAAAPGVARFQPMEKTREHITTFLRLPDGVLGGAVGGVIWMSGGKTEEVPSPKGVREIVESPTQPGRFFGTHFNGLCSWRRQDGKWILEGDWPGLSGELRSLVVDADGALWTSTPNSGVLRIEPEPDRAAAKRLDTFGEAEGLPVNRKRVWLDFVGGAPLFGTEQGRFRFDAATRRFRAESRYGAEADRVRVSAPDDRGGLWMIVENADGLPVEVVYGHDGRRDQLPMPDLGGMGIANFINWERRDGQEILWIGSENQLRQVDLVRWRRDRLSGIGPTLLREVAGGDGRPRATTSAPLQLRAGDSTLRFSFATPGLAGEAEAVHESRLLGYADGQVETGATGTRTFTNLPPGNYTFEARGRAADGRWSEPVRFAFAVLAPWWQTPAGMAVLGLAVAGLLFVYVRWRIRRLTRERHRLEAIVAERTAELARSNAELQRLHRLDQDEKLSARLSEEKARLELLRYQLNPHFLYNSLNSIRALVYSNAAAAGEMVTRLSEFCRWTLTRSADEMTTVADEAEMLQAYLDIERTRWQDGLKASIEVADDARGAPLPQFLLLPLLENAIKYGGKTSPDVLEVRIRIRRSGDHLLCEVANTGHWVELNGETPRESTRIGLENLRQRLRRHYGAD